MSATSPVASKVSSTIRLNSNAPVQWNRMYVFDDAPLGAGTGCLQPQSPSLSAHAGKQALTQTGRQETELCHRYSHMPNCVQVSS
jgi:hypothetical protein